MYDVAIIGGGVIGCAIARALSRYELSVVLLEKEAEVGFGTTKANSGIIHPGYHEPLDTLKGRLVVRGNQMFDKLHEELGFGFRRIGELLVAQSEEDLPKLDYYEKLAHEKGVPIERWSKERLQRDEPNLSKKLLCALYAPTGAVIDPYEFAFSLIESAQQNGVKLKVESAVTALEDRGTYLHITTTSGELDAQYVVNCAGLYADKIAGLLGLNDFTIHPRKGEEYMLDSTLKGLVTRLVFPVPTPSSKGILIIPTFGNTVMVGPTAIDTDDRSDISTTPEGAEQVFKQVRKLCPPINERSAIAQFAGLRAVSNTNDFIIGPTKVRGFINVAGIQSPGLTSSPAIAEYVLEILCKQGLTLVERNDFIPTIEKPARFCRQTIERQRELIRQNPLFGRIVCRCERITEAEIHQAIDRGARTVDGVKFRTRAGMGRCQGGFCTTRILQILSERLHVPMEAITKRGPGSWIVQPMDDTNSLPSKEP